MASHLGRHDHERQVQLQFELQLQDSPDHDLFDVILHVLSPSLSQT